MSGVIRDRRVPARLKGKVYKVAVRPAMVYGLETVTLTKRQEAEMEVAELKMLRFSLGVTSMDTIRNEYIRGTAHESFTILIHCTALILLNCPRFVFIREQCLNQIAGENVPLNKLLWDHAGLGGYFKMEDHWCPYLGTIH